MLLGSSIVSHVSVILLVSMRRGLFFHALFASEKRLIQVLSEVLSCSFFVCGVQIILRKVLLNLNLECDEAENGQIAVDLHRQGKRYDLVLMDKEMPVMDGHEATRQLRNMGVKTPIVALTGNALTTDRELFFEAGVDDFQTKVHIVAPLLRTEEMHGCSGGDVLFCCWACAWSFAWIVGEEVVVWCG